MIKSTEHEKIIEHIELNTIPIDKLYHKIFYGTKQHFSMVFKFGIPQRGFLSVFAKLKARTVGKLCEIARNVQRVRFLRVFSATLRFLLRKLAIIEVTLWRVAHVYHYHRTLQTIDK